MTRILVKHSSQKFKDGQSMETIREQFVALGERVHANDFSGFVGDPELLSLKKDVMRWTYRGFRTRQDMEKRFNADWRLLTDVLSEMEYDLEGWIPDSPVVVLGGGARQDRIEELKRIIDDLEQPELAGSD